MWDIFNSCIRQIVIINPTLLSYIPFLIFFGICLFKENNLVKILQLLILFIVGVISALSEPFTFYSIGLWSVVLFLMYGYGYIQILKINFVLFLYSTISLSIFLYSSLMLYHSDKSIYMFGIYLFYYFLHIMALSTTLKMKIQEYEKIIQSKKIVTDLGERVSILIHDTKNYLQKIEGGLYMLNKTHDTEKSKKYIEIIQNALYETNSKFEALLSLNKYSEIETYNLADTIHSLIYLHQLTSKGKSVRFTTDIDTITLKKNKLSFIQMIDNLLTNSIEANTKAINIMMTKYNGKITIIMSDNGIGIEKCKTCYNFKCIKCNLQSTKTNGHGLGIKSIQDCIKQMKGELLITSNDEGTRFSITIPEDKNG